MTNWDTLMNDDPRAYQAAYADWMYNPQNEYKCASCPHGNDGMDKNRSDYVVGPCGQQYCWVTCHCYRVTC